MGKPGAKPGSKRYPITKPMLDRMFELRALDVSYPAIARIISHDWKRPIPIHPGTVAHHLDGKVPKKPRGVPLNGT